MAKLKLKRHLITGTGARGCGICVNFCPKKVLDWTIRTRWWRQGRRIAFAASSAVEVPGFGDRGADGAGLIWAAN